MLETQPDIMGYFGLVSIILWGFAYIAVCKIYDRARWHVGLFALEKLAYVVVWMNFISSHSLGSVYEKDVLAGFFYTIYGANDLIFMLFFAFVFWKHWQKPFQMCSNSCWILRDGRPVVWRTKSLTDTYGGTSTNFPSAASAFSEDMVYIPSVWLKPEPDPMRQDHLIRFGAVA